MPPPSQADAQQALITLVDYLVYPTQCTTPPCIAAATSHVKLTQKGQIAQMILNSIAVVNYYNGQINAGTALTTDQTSLASNLIQAIPVLKHLVDGPCKGKSATELLGDTCRMSFDQQLVLGKIQIPLLYQLP